MLDSSIEMQRTILVAIGTLLLMACGGKTALDPLPEPVPEPGGGGSVTGGTTPRPPGPLPDPPQPPLPQPPSDPEPTFTGNISDIGNTCYSHYRSSITTPRTAPAGVIRIKQGSRVNFRELGPGNDSVHVEVNGTRVNSNGALPLNGGRNFVDIAVIGEGETHGWHTALLIDGVRVFEHEQPTLEPAFFCEDEMYRFRIFIDVNP